MKTELSLHYHQLRVELNQYYFSLLLVQIMTGHVKIQDIDQKVTSDHEHHNSSKINNPTTLQRHGSLPMLLQLAPTNTNS